MSATTDCTAGHYCPAGTIKPYSCPVGTFNPTVGSSSGGACLPCTGGKYCGTEALTAESGSCAEGYFCISNAPAESPVQNLTVLGTTPAVSKFGLCPQGYYCPAGTTTPIACPAGYYLDAEGSNALNDCILCPAGYYCNLAGLASPIGKCDAGYYCPEGSTSKQQSTCTAGHYCPLGSAIEIACPAGTYQPNTL